MKQHRANKGRWVMFNSSTYTYDTPDGTSVPVELVDNVQCLGDVVLIASIREKQRLERRRDGHV